MQLFRRAGISMWPQKACHFYRRWSQCAQLSLSFEKVQRVLSRAAFGRSQLGYGDMGFIMVPRNRMRVDRDGASWR